MTGRDIIITSKQLAQSGILKNKGKSDSKHLPL